MARKTKSESTDATKAERHEKRLTLLEDTANEICNRINDDPKRSFANRAVRSRTVELTVKLAALRGIRDACDAAEETIRKAGGEGDAPERPARVNLRD